QPAVNRNAEVRFQLPTAHELGNGAIQDERVKQIDVVHHEETSAMRVEAWGSFHLYLCARKEGDAPAKSALQPIMLPLVQNHREGDQYRRGNQKMQPAHSPKKNAAHHLPGLLHT